MFQNIAIFEQKYFAKVNGFLGQVMCNLKSNLIRGKILMLKKWLKDFKVSAK